MQDPPPSEVLVEAVRAFLKEHVAPRLDDPALGFRLKIADNLLRMVAAERGCERKHDAAQLARLRALLPDQEAADLEPREAIPALDRALAERIRAGSLDDPAAARRALLETLRERLSVSNPRFDPSLEIEGDP